jgi:hypothetical protein
MPTVRNGELFIRSHQDRMDVPFPHDKSWTANVARDPRVRIKIGNKLYEATMVLVADRAEAMAFLGRNPETVQKGPEGKTISSATTMSIVFSEGTSRSTAVVSHP